MNMSTEELDHDSTGLDHDFVHGYKGKKRSKKHLHHLFHISGTRRKKIATSVGSACGGTEPSFLCVVKSMEQSQGERGYEGSVFLLCFILVVGKERLRLNKGKNECNGSLCCGPRVRKTCLGKSQENGENHVCPSRCCSTGQGLRAAAGFSVELPGWLSPVTTINTEFGAYLPRVFACEGLLRFEVVSSMSRLGSLCHWGCQNTHLPIQWYHLKPASGPFHCYRLNCAPPEFI